MQPAPVAIAVRSQRQALDWSLVLISQGIETAIEGATEEHGWQLIVNSPDHERALAAIDVYRRENLRRRWHQQLPWTGLIFDWRSVVWFALLGLIFIGSENGFPVLRQAGVMDSAAVRHGERWRLCTAVMLHADLPHLLSNTTTGVLFLGLAMGAFGAGHALLASFLAGAGANLVALFLYSEPHRGLGSSGMVMGALGLLAVHSVTLLRAGIDARQLVMRAFLAGVLLLVLFGFHPGTDIVAHVTGFVIGAALGTILALFPNLARNEPANRISEIGCALLVTVSWWYALR